MRAPVLALAFAASLAPTLLAWSPGGRWALVGAWQTPLALLPWLALAGLPRAAGPLAAPHRWLVLWACLLPALALAVAGDLRSGRAAPDVARVAAAGLALGALLASAAERAPGSRIHALAWLVWVPGSAALVLAGEAAHLWSAGSGVGAQVLRASPLTWACSAAREGSAAAPWIALACGLLLQFSRWPGRALGEQAA